MEWNIRILEIGGKHRIQLTGPGNRELSWWCHDVPSTDILARKEANVVMANLIAGREVFDGIHQ
jgi:hypothetical protein